MSKNKLEELRREIDIINSQILELLAKRFNLVKEVALYKKNNNLPIEIKSREKEIFDNLLKENNGRIPEESLIKIFEVIISESKKVESREVKDDNCNE